MSLKKGEGAGLRRVSVAAPGKLVGKKGGILLLYPPLPLQPLHAAQSDLLKLHLWSCHLP